MSSLSSSTTDMDEDETSFDDIMPAFPNAREATLDSNLVTNSTTKGPPIESESTLLPPTLPAPRIRNVRFVSPLLEYGYRPAVEATLDQSLNEKPLLLYLPGFDGTYLSPFLQFPELHTIFDVRCLTIPMDDRSTLDELCEAVVQYLQSTECAIPSPNVADSNSSTTTPSLNETRPSVESTKKRSVWPSPKVVPVKPERPQRRSVYLAGESFGGILAILVSLKLLEQDTSLSTSSIQLQGLVLINAATCYDRSRLALEGPIVAKLNPWLYPLGLLKLLPMFTDEYSVAQLMLLLQSKALPSVIDNACREAYLGRVALSLPFVIPFMTQETLQWRLSEWLETGCARLAVSEKESSLLNNRNRNDNEVTLPVAFLSQLSSLRTLIVAGEMDATLPSIAEAERLASIWSTNAVVHVVEGAGHASTCGSRVDLAALMRSRFVELQPPKRKAAPTRAKQAPKPKTNSNKPFWWWQQQGESTDVVTDTAVEKTKGPQPDSTPTDATVEVEGRTAMKEVARNGKGEYFGLEPRYDNASIGLSPLRYWNKEYYKRYIPPSTKPRS